MPDFSHDFFDGEDQPVTMECLGLQLDYSPDEFGTPVEVLVVAKVIHRGDFAYRLISTQELNSVEAMGMLRWGQLLLESGIMQRVVSDDDDDSTEEEK